MRDAVRFTVSVPSDLLDAVDQKLMKSEASRSALVRRLLERALREAEEQEQIESYVR
jgi:metal-responsive CopG/Arc/MetJ family transcriptional regulator